MRNASVRVNLSVPARVDALLAELALLTGQSKAALVMEGLTWYLPRLHLLRDRLRDPSASREALDKREEVEELFPALVKSGHAPLPSSRAERRRKDRELRKLQKRSPSFTAS